MILRRVPAGLVIGAVAATLGTGMPRVAAQDAPPGPPKAAAERVPLPARRDAGSPVSRIFVSPDGAFVAAETEDHRVVAWKAASAKPVVTMEGVVLLTAVLRSDPPRLFVSPVTRMDQAPEVTAWDLATAKVADTIKSLTVENPTRSRSLATRGDVSIVGDLPSLGAVVVGFAELGAVVTDLAQRRILGTESLALHESLDRLATLSHFHTQTTYVAAADDGTRLVADSNGLRILTWPKLERVWGIEELTPPDDLRGPIAWLTPRFLSDGVSLVVQVHAADAAKARSPYVVCIDTSKPATPVVWKLKGATLTDVASHGRDLVLATSDAGVLCVDGRTGKVLRKLATADARVSDARFIPGSSYAWLSKGPKGTLEALSVPERPAK